MSIGDIESNERGSGARYNSGKPDFSLIPLAYLAGEARVWQHGARKYSAWNWRKGMPWSVPLACLLRHLSAWQEGEDLDPESGLPHLDHVACNLRMLQVYAQEFPEGDDRYTPIEPKPLPELFPLPEEALSFLDSREAMVLDFSRFDGSPEAVEAARLEDFRARVG